MNPFHKWILDVWVSLLFKNQIKLRAARLSFSVFLFFKAFHPCKEKPQCLRQCTQWPHHSGRRVPYFLVENFTDFKLVQNPVKWHICYEWALSRAPFPHSQYVHWLSLHIKLNMWLAWLLTLTHPQRYTSHHLKYLQSAPCLMYTPIHSAWMFAERNRSARLI